MTDMAVTTSSKLTLYFAIRLADGSVVDSNFDKAPASFTMGDGSLLHGFEQCLVGLLPGDQKTFELSPEHGFGQQNPANEQEFPRHQFAGINLEPGLVVTFADASQSELAGVVKSLAGDKVIVDFNHPLAGKNLLFDVHILEVS